MNTIQIDAFFTTTDHSLLPEPMELAEHELEAVSGGLTPGVLPVAAAAAPAVATAATSVAVWAWVGAAAAVATAAAAVLDTVNHIEEELAKDRNKKDGY
jgi:hypothetical protein